VWELAQLERQTQQAPYDLVVVDAPATGHGVGILRTPKTFAEIARVGPIARQGRRIATTIADPDFTAVIAVSTAEEMPVNETLALREALLEDEMDLDAVILNALYPTRFSTRDTAKLERSLAHADSPVVRSALQAALSEHARAALQTEQLTRLSDGLGFSPVELPYVFEEEIGKPELELLADALESSLLGAAGNGAGPAGRNYTRRA
jgi:anion-transporting  ArsA/GET3 family ATPase